ncbi:MAG TPA: FecR domain-containing protein [Cyclobacteriaceae bacterium]|nr:FecR domain-containing protein [Cyclobacteriaceae bacterium]
MNSENDLMVNDDLIAKYLSGAATPEEAIALHDWMTTPENKRHFRELESAWNAANPSKKMPPINKMEAWEKIQPRAKERSLFSPQLIGIAATVVLAVVASLMYFSDGLSDTTVMLTADTTKSITLHDESRVTMYRNSSLEIPEKFKGSTREVTLAKGEAYFDVTKNVTKPFIVHAGFADIRVVGTEFNVTVKNDEVVVAVNEGRVLFYTANDSVYIDAGTAASLRPSAPATTIDVDANTWAYASRKLVFKDTPMHEVIGIIEKTYGRTIQPSNDSVKNCKLTARFNDEPVEKIVLLIAESLNLKLTKNGQVFILEGESCP